MLASSFQSRLRGRRLEGLWRLTEEERLDVLVVAGRGIISQYGLLMYVCGYVPVVRHAYAVVSQGSEPTLIVPTAADGWQARRIAGLADVRVAGQGDVVSAYDDLPSGVVSVLRERGAANGRIGLAGFDQIVPSGEHEALSTRLVDAELVDATDAVLRLKAVKGEEELHECRRTVEIADTGIEACLARLRAGATGWEVAAGMEQAVRARGAREVLIFVSADPYFLAPPDERRFRTGDLVTAYVEITGATGYWVERGIVVAIGSVDGEKQALAEACLAAAREAEAELRAGRTAGDVARAIDTRASAAGAAVGIWHGHGVGVDHDLPVLTAGDTTPLLEAMVISIHPNFSSAAEGFGASVADTYAVRRGPAERLSSVPQELYRR